MAAGTAQQLGHPKPPSHGAKQGTQLAQCKHMKPGPGIGHSQLGFFDLAPCDLWWKIFEFNRLRNAAQRAKHEEGRCWRAMCFDNCAWEAGPEFCACAHVLVDIPATGWGALFDEHNRASCEVQVLIAEENCHTFSA